MSWRYKKDYFQVSVEKLQTMLSRQIVEQGKLFTYDNVYNIPYFPAYWIKKCRAARKYPYNPKNPNEMDCDKRVKIFRGWIAENFFINIGMEAVLEKFVDGGWVRHNEIVFLDTNAQKDENGKYQLIFSDLQTGKMVDKKESDEYKIIQIRA